MKKIFPIFTEKSLMSDWKKKEELMKGKDLVFLKEEKIEMSSDDEYWSLNGSDGFLPPRKFSNGKNQRDVVEEIVGHVKKGKKFIFLKGSCGSGKSAIALNVARVLGRASIVVPLKNLQKQYEKDYVNNFYLVRDGKKLSIAMLTGRDNHDSIFKPGVSCADPLLPDNIKITEKNFKKLLDYTELNPFLNKHIRSLKDIRRLSVAPANPYWSPIIPKEFDISMLGDAKKHLYKGADGRDYVFYHRKEGCSYYDQYLSYLKSDVIIFNSAKYLSEINIGRKPFTDVDIIDEGDEFLDSLFFQDEINLSLVKNLLNRLNVDESSMANLNEIVKEIELEEINKRAVGVDSNKIFPLKDTRLSKVFSLLLKDEDIENEIILEESKFLTDLLESAYSFSENKEEVFVTYKKEDDNLYVKLVSTNLSAKMEDLMSKTKSMVFMSGTIHSEEVLKRIFGIEDFEVVEAESELLGTIEIGDVGGELDCNYSNLNKEGMKEKYYGVFEKCIRESERPSLVHIHAYKDLPDFNKNELISSNELRKRQDENKNGEDVESFKNGEVDILYSTKCSRGVDFPGDRCKSIIFSKFPNPNIGDVFWKVLKNNHPDYFWLFYRDKARREFLQRIFRGVRSKEDRVKVYSPDLRVLMALRSFI